MDRSEQEVAGVLRANSALVLSWLPSMLLPVFSRERLSNRAAGATV